MKIFLKSLTSVTTLFNSILSWHPKLPTMHPELRTGKLNAKIKFFLHFSKIHNCHV